MVSRVENGRKGTHDIVLAEETNRRAKDMEFDGSAQTVGEG